MTWMSGAALPPTSEDWVRYAHAGGETYLEKIAPPEEADAVDPVECRESA